MSVKGYIIVIFLFPCLIFTQEQSVFKKIQQFKIHGNAVLIGNNIVSQNDRKPFNDFSFINDQVRMTYVDIDKDGTTFSSSSASLNIVPKDAKIISATLYWSGVYPFDKGVKRESSREIFYVGNETRNNDINTVKFKGPSGNYETVKGQIIFDGFGKEEFLKSAPYACFADVSDAFRNTTEINGEYTVANVRATQGYVSGGSAAGWFLFIVYESENEVPRYITTNHGFSSLNDNSTDVKFSDFKAKQKGEIDAALYVATLEGDSKLSRDQCDILNATSGEFVPLKNSLRSAKNFFNSKISIDDKFFTSRRPNSSNTLGFDLLKMQIPKNILSNNQTETTIRFGTRADRFYLFFTAFSIEISALDDTIQELETEPPISEITTIKTEEPIKEESQIEKDSEEKVLMDKVSVAKPKLSIKQMEKQLKKVDLKVPSIDKGYYLITNVFSKPTNAKRWENFLTSKGHSPKTFINPKNNWHYVYIYNNEDLKMVFDTHQELSKLDFLNEIWVYKINMK